MHYTPISLQVNWKGEMSTNKVFQQFYVELIKTLPMDDAFLAKLFAANLLPGDIEDQMHLKSTRADKAILFLDHVVKPSVMTGVGRNFDDLI